MIRPGIKFAGILACATFFLVGVIRGGWMLLDAARIIWDNERTTGRVVSVGGTTVSVEYDTPRGKGWVVLEGQRRNRPAIGDPVPVLYYAGDPLGVAVADAPGELVIRPLLFLVIAAGAAVLAFKMARE